MELETDVFERRIVMQHSGVGFQVVQTAGAGLEMGSSRYRASE